MQQNLTEQTVVYSSKNDIEKSFDYVLPEYLPGISRIVKTNADIEKCNFFGSVGECGCHISLKISIIYTSEYDGKIKSTSFREELSVPFRDSFEYTGEYTAIPSCFILSCVSVMQSPRKLATRLAIQAGVTVYGKKETPLFSPSDDGKMCVLKDSITSCNKKILPETHFEKTLDISIDESKPAVAQIIHASAAFGSISASPFDKGFNFNAEAGLCILYENAPQDEDGQEGYSYLSTSISLNDTFRDDSIKASDEIFIYIDIYSVEPSVSLDPFGESRQISLAIKYAVTGFACESKELELITDAFIKGCEACPEFSSVGVDTLHSVVSQKQSIRQTLHTDMREITEVSVCNARILSVSMEHSDGKFIAAARCRVLVFGTNLSGELSASDIPVTLKIPIGNGENASADTIPEVIINITSCSAEIKDGALLIDFEIAIDGVFIKHSHHTLVCALEEGEASDCRKNGKIIIYYPSKNDKIWDIAKKYRVSPDEICSTNSVDGKDICTKRTILIP